MISQRHYGSEKYPEKRYSITVIYTGSHGEVNDFLGVEERFGEPAADVGLLDALAEGSELVVQVAALEGNDAIGDSVDLVFAVDVAAKEFLHPREVHDPARHDEVELLVALPYVAVLKGYVLKPYGLGDLPGHLHLLADAVDEVEPHIREEYGKRQTGDAPSGSEVEHARAWGELEESGDGERVKHMVHLKVIDILARDDVDLGVPLPELFHQGVELPSLLIGESRKIFLYDF